MYVILMHSLELASQFAVYRKEKVLSVRYIEISTGRIILAGCITFWEITRCAVPKWIISLLAIVNELWLVEAESDVSYAEKRECKEICNIFISDCLSGF